MVDALGGFTIVAGFSQEDVGDEGLRVAVVEREPTGLDLDHDAMTGKENVVRVWQREMILQRRVGGDRFWIFEAFAVTAAKDIRRNHQLVAAHFLLGSYFV